MNIDESWQRIVKQVVHIPDSALGKWGESAENYILLSVDRSSECMNKIKNVQKILTACLMHILKEKNAEIYCFGSPFLTGVLEHKSDIDVVVLRKEDVRKPLSEGDACTPQARSEQNMILNSISTTALRLGDIFSSIQERPRARVPYVRASLKNGLEIDISAYRRNGVRNTLLIQQYFSKCSCQENLLNAAERLYAVNLNDSAFNSALRMFSIGLKLWGKRTGLIDPVQSFLTSYAFNVMLCYYINQRGFSQFIHPESISIPCDSPTIPVHRPLVQDGEYRHFLLGYLMRDFLTFYNYEFDYYNSVVSLSRKVHTTKSSLGWGLREEERLHGTAGNSAFYRFCVEDPYEDHLSLGRFVSPLRFTKLRMALHFAQLNGFGYANLKELGAYTTNKMFVP